MRTVAWMLVLCLRCDGGAMEAEMNQANQDAEAELRAKKQAERVAETQKRIEKLQLELVEMDTKVDIAVDAVVAAQNENDRGSAKAKLEALRKEKAAMERQGHAAAAIVSSHPDNRVIPIW